MSLLFPEPMLAVASRSGQAVLIKDPLQNRSETQAAATEFTAADVSVALHQAGAWVRLDDLYNFS